jgi:hypothetical protein
MKPTVGRLLVTALIAFAAGSLSISSPAAAKGQSLTVEVIDPSQAITNSTVQFVDTTGASGTCNLFKLRLGGGDFKCDTTNRVPPLLLLDQIAGAGGLYSISETGIGTAIIDPITNIGIQEIYLGLGTSADLQWASTSPLPLTPPMLGSSVGLLDRTFAKPMVAYNFPVQTALTYDFYTTKPTSSFVRLMEHFDFTLATNANVQITLPGSIDYSATITPLPSVFGSSSRWSVEASTGTSYFSAFAIYPNASNASSVYTGVGEYYTGLFGILKHEGSKLNANNLSSIYSPSYFNDGNNSLVQSELDATRLRQLKVSQYSVGTIASLQNDVPTSGSSLIRANVLRISTDHGVPCTDECCVSLVCSSGVCLDYGDQRIARIGLDWVSATESSGGSPSNSFYLNATGSAPTGTLSGLTIDDLSGIYPSVSIPFTQTRDITIKPLYNEPGSTLGYDFYGLHAVIVPPVPPSDRFTFDPIPITGSVPSTTLFPPSSTTELFNLIKAPEQLGDFLGKKAKFEWKLPLTMLVTGQSISGDECNADQTQQVNSKPVSPGATSATLAFDKALGGHPITGVDFHITQRSFDGPTLRYSFNLGTSCSF